MATSGPRIAHYAVFVLTLTGSLVMPGVGAAPAQPKLPEPAASSGLEARGADDLVYPFVVMPRRITLTDAQVEQVREAAVAHVVSYHEAQAEENRAASANFRRGVGNSVGSDEQDQWLRMHTQAVLGAQHRNSQTIFMVVLFIVFIALALTVYQFVRDSALAQRVAVRLLGSTTKSQARSRADALASKGAADGAGAQPAFSDAALTAVAKLTAEHPESKDALLDLLKELRPSSSVSLGPNGLQLGSQIVGLVVLTFSLAFFYLYLSHVYPIEVKHLSQVSVQARDAADKEAAPTAAPAASEAKK
jgi:hypothetical protein